VSCDLEAALLSGYLDGELDEASCARVEAHLDACAACRAELERLAELDRELAESAPPGGWDAFGGRLLARIAARERTRAARSRRTLRAVASLAAAAALLTAVAIGYRAEGLPPEDVPAADLAVAAAHAPEFDRLLARLEVVLRKVENLRPDDPGSAARLARFVHDANLVADLAEARRRAGSGELADFLARAEFAILAAANNPPGHDGRLRLVQDALVNASLANDVIEMRTRLARAEPGF